MRVSEGSGRRSDGAGTAPRAASASPARKSEPATSARGWAGLLLRRFCRAGKRQRLGERRACRRLDASRARFETCSKVYRNADGRKTPFKSQKRCFEMCEDFRQRTCLELGHAPYVCNGCDRQTTCPLRKRYYAAGTEFFKALFPVVLTDNGSEFSDPKMIEFYRVDPEHNPTKLERRTYVFFCDPYNSQQKPHVERNHEEIRRVLVKGSSFDALTQEDVNLALSHVNPAPRPSLDGKSPYDEFVSFHGELGRVFLERLGIRRVNAESVVLDPILLGGKFKKEANRAILRRHGVL